MTALQLQMAFERQLNNPSFGEDIIYTPAGGTPIPLKAHVYREEYEQQGRRFTHGEVSNPVKYDIKIRISSRLVTGITERRDTVTARLKLCNAPSTLKVMAVIGQDPGTWLLGLTA
jgi:hypothetical protein